MGTVRHLLECRPPSNVVYLGSRWCRLIIFLAMTSFKGCHPQLNSGGAPGTITEERPESTHNPGIDRGRRNWPAGQNPQTSDPASPYLRPQWTHLHNNNNNNNSSNNTTSRPQFPSRRNVSRKRHHRKLNNNLTRLNDGEGPDLTTLFSSSFSSSSFPDDVLADADIAELFNRTGIWTNNRQLRKKLKPLRRRILKDGLVTKKTYKGFSKVITRLVVVFTVVGFVTNALALRVFSKLRRSVTNRYMMCLCLSDTAFLVFLVSTVAAVAVVRRVALETSMAKRVLYFCDVTHFLVYSTRQVVIVTTALMSLERYASLASIFKTHRRCSSSRTFFPSRLLRRPVLLTGLCSLLVLALNSPMLLKREVSCRRVEGIARPACYLSYTPVYLRHRSAFDDLSIVGSCVFQYCPLVVMVLANGALLVSLHRYSRSIGTASISPENDNQPTDHPRGSVATICSTIASSVASTERVTSRPQFFRLEKGQCLTVIAYSALFFLLALPLAVLPVLTKAIPDFNVLRPQHYAFLMYVRLFLLLDAISASINFFVFLVKGGAFRAAVLSLFKCKTTACCCCKKGELKLGDESGPSMASSSSSSESSEGGVWPWVSLENTLCAVVLKRSVRRRETDDCDNETAERGKP